MNNNVRAATIILRWGLAFVFFYAAISGLLKPEEWIGFLPQFLQDIFSSFFSPKLLLTIFSVYEIVLAVWIFLGKKALWAAALAAATLLGIIILNFGSMAVVFRDIGLLFAALALLELVRSPEHKNTENNSL